MNPYYALLWIVALPLVAPPLIYLAGRWGLKKLETPSAAPARWLALAFLATAVYPVTLLGAIVTKSNGIELKFGAIVTRFDGISLLMAVVALTLGIAVTLFSMVYMAKEENEEKFYAMLVAMVGSIIGLSIASDLFNLWVWFEAMAVSSYLLVAFYREEKSSLEAGFKYLVQSAAGSVLVLMGIALVFLHTGQLELHSVLRVAAYFPSPILLAGGALMIIGFGIKAALVPMHTWLPDAHSQAPSGISAMLSGIVIQAGLIAMLRAVGALYINNAPWGAILLGFGALNMLVGNLMALRQTQVKRMLAYSSIANVGYILLGIGITMTYHQIDGSTGGFFHLANHALMKGLAFLAAGGLLYALHLANHEHRPLLVTDLDGASRRYPVTALVFSLSLLALGGFPPLAGFMSKWQIFTSGVYTQQLGAILLVIFAAVNSVISLGYYAPLVNRIYRRQPSEIVLSGKTISPWMTAPLVVIAVAIVAIGFWPNLLAWLTGPATRALLATFGG